MDALHQVPGHLFVPRRAWVKSQEDRPNGIIDRATDPDDWYDAVYHASTIVTQ